MNAMVILAAMHMASGLADPSITQDNIATTICVPGWTSEHRHVTEKTKEEVCKNYGLTSCAGKVIDHIIPLSVGGSNDIANLQPQSVSESKSKDVKENNYHRAVCKGSVLLIDAQRYFIKNYGH